MSPSYQAHNLAHAMDMRASWLAALEPIVRTPAAEEPRVSAVAQWRDLENTFSNPGPQGKIKVMSVCVDRDRYTQLGVMSEGPQ